ncbi:MAG: AtpZ/AtpI family protein [Firmicutes bacterium]|nr:AtpZ/AtpI family protein [Bacillota bacterium]
MKIDRKWLREALNNISVYGQMGFTIVVPPVLLCLLGSWLRRKFGLGYWVILVAILVGLLSAFTTIYRICMDFLAKNTKDDGKNRKISYRKHR